MCSKEDASLQPLHFLSMSDDSGAVFHAVWEAIKSLQTGWLDQQKCIDSMVVEFVEQNQEARRWFLS